jgi:hypothetical protein
MEEAREYGIEIGKAEGIAQGEARKAIETARAMIKDGIPVETASKYSGIPVDELRRHIKLSNASQLPQ